MPKDQTDQEKLIGTHKYVGEDIFSRWLLHEDKPVTETKRHRQLLENSETRSELIEALSDWIIEHHISTSRIGRLKRKKQIMDKHDYLEFVNSQEYFPKSDITKKGNATEILMAEYIKFTSELDLLVFRLRYNPNVDQSMKGDDSLLFNKKNLRHKIIVGESKYRSTPNRQSVETISDSFKENKTIPISIPFVASIVESEGDEELAGRLEDLNAELYKQKVPIVNVGFLLSTINTSNVVETHLNSDNKNFLILSLGLDNPIEIIDESFALAIKKIQGI